MIFTDPDKRFPSHFNFGKLKFKTITINLFYMKFDNTSMTHAATQYHSDVDVDLGLTIRHSLILHFTSIMEAQRRPNWPIQY